MSLAMGAPGKISEVKRNLDGAIVLDDIADIDERVRQIERQNR